MEHDPIAGPSTSSSSTRSSPSKPVLDESWTQVETLPDADDSDYEQEEEVSYVTLDFGSDLSPEILSQLESFQLASLNSKQPWARLGDNFLRGVHERTLGSDVLFISRPPDPDTGKPTLLEPLTTSSSRIRFEKVLLTSKTSSNGNATAQIERPSPSAFLAPLKRGVRGGSGYKPGGGPGGGANRGRKTATGIARATTSATTRRKRGQKDTPQEAEEAEEEHEDADLNEEDGEAEYKEATPDTTPAPRKTRAKKAKETPATPSSEGRQTRSRGTASATAPTSGLPPLPLPEPTADSADIDAPPLDEEGISQFLRDQDTDMQVENSDPQPGTSSAFPNLSETFPDIEEF